jgi:hypothetical protein
LTYLGEAERELGETADAERHLRAAFPFARVAGMPDLTAQLLCQYALTLLRLDRFAEAEICVGEVVDIYRAGGAVFEHPEYLFWTVAQVYHACGKRDQSQQLLTEAADLRLRRMSRLTEPAARRGFLAIRWNREIEAAVTRAQWPAWLEGLGLVERNGLQRAIRAARLFEIGRERRS